MRKAIYSLIIISLFMMIFGTMVYAGYPIKVMDDLNVLTEIKEKPMRIVSLSPSNTEILFALEVSDRLIGRTDYCDFPPEVREIPSVGGYSQPSVETIMALQPDLVLASFGTPRELLEQLRTLGVSVVGYNPQTLEDILNLIWEIGKITGTEEKAAQLINDMNERINTVKEKVRDADRPLVFWEVWHDPIYTAGPGTYIDDLINLAGGVNLAADTTTSWPVYSLEMLLVKNPDVYIATKDQWSGPGNIAERPGYSEIKAVQNDRVYVIDGNLVNRPGPRLIDGLEIIAKIIHPELFE